MTSFRASTSRWPAISASAAHACRSVILICVATVQLDDGSDGRVARARAKDVETGEEFVIEAQAYVATAGPWSQQLLGASEPKMKLVKGVHLVMPAIPGADEAFLLTAPQDGRVFFVIPWYGRTLV